MAGIKISDLEVFTGLVPEDAHLLVTQNGETGIASIESIFSSADTFLQKIIDTAVNFSHPVGSYYWSEKDTNPTELFGGVWEPVEDCFVYAVGARYPEVNMVGGETEVILKEEEMPAHTHGEIQLEGSTVKDVFSGSQLDPVGSGIVTGVKILNQNFSSSGTSSNAWYRWDINASHEHASVGENFPHNNMPPFVTAYCWKRIE